MRLLYPLLLSFAVSLWSGVAFADHFKIGPAFSDPAITVPMPDSWVKQPIERGKVDLKVMLDQQMYRVLAPFIRRYANVRGLNISLSDGTCGNSAGTLLKKQADIGGFCCPPRNSDRLPGLRFYTLGITPISLIIHPDNPISDVTVDEARGIFSGSITRWSQLKRADGRPGPNKPIQQVARLHCKPRPGHWRLILDNEDQFSINLKEVGTIPDMLSSAANNIRSIGHVSAWLAINDPKKKVNVKSLKIDGIPPTDIKALVEGRYPFYKTFSITIWEGANVENSHAKDLQKFLLKQVERLDEKYLIATPNMLRKAGWQFNGYELIGSQ
ncbi:MAG: substrate-binding domain-containing protein [Magnetococcales bacterium]|nr:substrate-binding domain-containing protein [Magnetococcales bacterium]